MGEYRQCAHCGNSETGAVIYSCDNCGQIYCSECLPNNHCGNYEQDWGLIFFKFSRLGVVEDDD